MSHIEGHAETPVMDSGETTNTQGNGEGLNGSLSAAKAAADSFLGQVNAIQTDLLDRIDDLEKIIEGYLGALLPGRASVGR